MKPQQRRTPDHALLLMLAAVAAGLCTTARAGPINTDVAMTPRKGGSILRLQYIYGEVEGKGEIEDIRTSRIKATYVFGLKSNLALFLTETYVNRKVERITPELVRMAEDYAAERRAAGRPVPEDIELITSNWGAKHEAI